MLTEKNIKDLKIILSNLSYKDYIEAYRKSARYLKGPYTKSGRQRRFKGYTLSDEAIKVHNYIIMALNPGGFEKEEIEEIKRYLLNIKLNRSYLLEDRYMEKIYN